VVTLGEGNGVGDLEFGRGGTAGGSKVLKFSRFYRIFDGSNFVIRSIFAEFNRLD
jgi:hypothetical protein